MIISPYGDLPFVFSPKLCLREVSEFALPTVVWNEFDRGSLVEGADNIIAALEHSERVYEINFGGVPS